MDRQRRQADGSRRSRSRLGRAVVVLLSATVLIGGVGVAPAMARTAQGWAASTVARTAVALTRPKPHPAPQPSAPPATSSPVPPAPAASLSRTSSAPAVAPTPDDAAADDSTSPAALPPSATATGTASPAGPSGGAYRVVGLGDSVPSGSNCGCTNYVTLVTRAVASSQGKTALVHNDAQGGLTTAGVLAQLSEPSIRAEIGDADLVIITIGANDFDTGVLTAPSCQPDPATACYTQTLARQRTQLTSILNQVRTLQAAHGGQTLVTGYWNVFLDGDVAEAQGSQYVQDSDQLTLAENTQIASLSSQAGARYVDIAAPFRAVGNDTALLAPDGDHPSAAGHALIAKTLLASLS